MKNINDIGKKLLPVFFAAAVLAVGNFMGHISITAEEAVEIQEMQQAGDTEDFKAVELVSGNAIELVSGGSIQVEALSGESLVETYETGGKQIKLNFSYKLLGCVKVDSYLNVRKERDTDAEITGKLSNNTFCNVLDVYHDGWAKIKSGKISGYVSTEYLLIGEKAQQAALKKAKRTVRVKNTSRLNVRSLPSTSTKVYGQIKKKNNVSVKYEQVTKKQVRKLLKKNKSLRRQLGISSRKNMLKSDNLDNWICVKYNGKTAFVSKDYAKVIYTVKVGSAENKKTSALSKKVVAYAKKFLGNRYVYGGSSLKHGTDCSGFTMKVYQHFGYRLARSSAAQARNGRKVKRSKLQPGDLLFYKKKGRISHVSMYIGSGKVIHASNEKNGIIISSVRYRKACRCVRILK